MPANSYDAQFSIPYIVATGLLRGRFTLDELEDKAIADGEQLLVELGALTEELNLTPLGKELSRLPLDPRVGRMLLAARDQQALQEALVIASALSVQDVRDRPSEAQAAADQAHAKFDDEKSEFSGYLTLWKWLEKRPATPPWVC